MSLLSVLANLPADFIVPLDGEARTPLDGERAYTMYRGNKYVGVLTDGCRKIHYDTLHIWYDGFERAYAEMGFLYVGYDGPIIWDDAAKMWNAHADHD